MLSRIAWSLCTRAFEASQDRGVALSMRRSLQQFGVIWFWAALALDGRALDVWREYRTKLAGGPLRLPVAIGGATGPIPVLAAWSLPNVPKMRGLGLGRVWVVACPLCRRYHLHAPEEGSRPAHCGGTATGPAWYALRYDGEMPRAFWDQFQLSVLADKPKMLQPPYRSLLPSARKAAA